MKKILSLIAAILALVAVAPALQAQTATYNTVTSAALNATQTCFLVASTTNMSASGAATGAGGAPQEWDLWTDGEFMKINTINTTSNQVCVMRGKSPTRAGIHATGQVVFFGPAGRAPFILSPPDATNPGVVNLDGQFGSCVSTQYAFLPLINVLNGSIWNCLTSARGSRWTVYGFRMWTQGHPVTNIVDLAYTATLAEEFINYTSLTATRILTLPNISGVIGKTMVILNNATGNQTITLTPVFNQCIGPLCVATLAQANTGSVTRLISVTTSTGATVWNTW